MSACQRCSEDDCIYIRYAELESKFVAAIDMLARERDAFGKKETELAMKLRKAREGFLDIQKHYKIISPENYKYSGAYQIAKKVLEELK